MGTRAKSFLGGIGPRLVGMIIVAVAPLVGLHAAKLHQERQQLIAAAGTRALEIARRGAELYKEPIVEAQTLLQVASQVPEVVAGSAESCASFLGRAGQNRNWANGFWVFGMDGRVICTTVPNGIGIDVSDRDYFRQAIERRQFVVSDFFVSKLRNHPASMAALPVIDGNGHVVRVLAVTLQLSWFGRLAAELGQDADARVMLFDGKGTLLAHYPERTDWIGKNWREHPLMAKAGKDGWGEVEPPVGPAQIYGWLTIPATKGLIAVGFDRAKVLERVNAQIVQAGAALAAALLLAALGCVALARGIARPLKILTAGAEAARRSAHADLPAITGYAEVESLAVSLNQLLADRRERENALRTARAEAEKAEEQARAATARLLDAIEAVPVALAFFDAEDRYVLWNKRYEEIYAESRDLLRPGLRFEDRLRAGLARGQYAEAKGREEEWLAQRLALHRNFQSCHEQRLPGDRWLRVEERRTSDGGSIGMRVDISELKRREESFRLLFDSNPVPMWVLDRETLRFLAVNDAAVAHYGYSREQFLMMTILDIRRPEDHKLAAEVATIDKASFGERIWRHIKRDGTEIHVCVYSRSLSYEGRPAKLAAAIDVTERRLTEARITHMAHHDGLTDLANRTLFRDRLEKSLAKRRAEGRGLALHCIDLDYFKAVNDTLGHPIGDALLRLVADRLRDCVRTNDMVARLGGDEFAIIQDDIASPQEASALADRLIEALSAPYGIDGHEVIVAASIGIATALDNEHDPDLLLRNADMALYRAKSDGRRTHRFFEPDSRWGAPPSRMRRSAS